MKEDSNSNAELRQLADEICKRVLIESLPDAAVARALQQTDLNGGRVIVVAVGKAAWQMANAASVQIGNRIDRGIVITKYDHAQGNIDGFDIYEAGHPVVDENSVIATEAAIAAVNGLDPEDKVLLLLSGGGSALFEKPLIPMEMLASVTKSLLASGADIVEINTIRKRLSAVKGGRFAQLCAPAHVYSIILSDIIGDPPDMIASGPAYPDSSSAEQALSTVKKYDLTFPNEVMELLGRELPDRLDNVTTIISGGVAQLTETAKTVCEALGFRATVLTDSLDCEAREAGRMMAAVARYNSNTVVPQAIIAGGETVVHITGKGRGGRNQELALAAAEGIAGSGNAAIFSLASDGTDGPTDASGGYVDGYTKQRLQAAGVDIHNALADNDAYTALQKCGGLIMTGPTGTNVNDITVALVLPNKTK